jgi:hypothetical protein
MTIIVITGEKVVFLDQLCRHLCKHRYETGIKCNQRKNFLNLRKSELNERKLNLHCIMTLIFFEY